MLKVCGLTRLCDLRLALRLGADYVGAVVEVERSPRSVSRETAARLLRASEGRGAVVTELVEAGALRELVEAVRPAVVQLHAGPEPEVVARLAAELRAEVWPVLAVPADPMEAEGALGELLERAQGYAEAGARHCLVDARAGGRTGGTGQQADWRVAAQLVAQCPVPVILAGGISPANATKALAATGAAGLDVSSGVERAPGIKDAALMRGLFGAVCRPTP